MPLYTTQNARNTLGVSWAEEYMLGLIAYHCPLSTKDAISLAEGTLSYNTAHKYITELINRKLVEQVIGEEDRRLTFLHVTKKGTDVLNFIEGHTDE